MKPYFTKYKTEDVMRKMFHYVCEKNINALINSKNNEWSAAVFNPQTNLKSNYSDVVIMKTLIWHSSDVCETKSIFITQKTSQLKEL